MRITHTADPDAGTVRLTIEFPADGDPVQVADIAWSAVSRILTRAARERGTVPERLRSA